MKKYMYIVKYSTGEWDDFYEETVFVTHDRKLALSWVTKFHRILKEYRKYYRKNFGEKYYDYWKPKEEFYHIGNRFWKLETINNAYIQKIEIR